MINTTGDPNKNVIPVFVNNTQGKKVEVLAGSGIGVSDLSDANTYRFEVEAIPYIPLTTNLTLVAKAAGVAKSVPVLKGTVIDRVELTFAYNKAIAGQTLVNTGGLSVPTLLPADVGFNYIGQTINSNLNFTLQGNDGLSQPGSIASDVETLSFGNVMYIGKGASKIGAASSGMEAFIEALASGTIKTARQTSYFATGGVNEKHFVAYPKAWGLATFTKGIFSGGYIRLINVGGVMATGGTPETDLVITNSAGFAEAYYVYESLYDDQNDPVTPFVIS